MGFIPGIPEMPEMAAGSGRGFHDTELQRRGQSGKGRTTLLRIPLRHPWIALGNLWDTQRHIWDTSRLLWDTPGTPLGHPRKAPETPLGPSRLMGPPGKARAGISVPPQPGVSQCCRSCAGRGAGPAAVQELQESWASFGHLQEPEQDQPQELQGAEEQ